MTTGRHLRFIPFVLFLAVAGCSGDEGTAPPATGTLRGTVADLRNGQPLAGARVIVSDGATNAPLGSLTTGTDGVFALELVPGSYTVKVSRQGFDPVPPPGIDPLPLTVTAGQTSSWSGQMAPSSVANGGWISGRVTGSGNGVPGILVAAESRSAGYSTVTDGLGYYWLYNVPADSYAVRAQKAGLASSVVPVRVQSSTEVSSVNLVVAAATAGAVAGHVTFLATTNAEVDVTLLNPLSGEPVPGLAAPTVGQNYLVVAVPPGTYLSRASYRNDGKVMDPDWIVKNGQPTVTVGTDTVDRDFSLTGAVELVSPTNPATSTQPLAVQGTLPVLSWSSYSSADEYVVEVSDQSGRVIWGGFANDWTVRRVVVPRTVTSIRYNADSSATEGLQAGRMYRWRIYASKDDSREPTGWKLISVSEEQRGLIRIVQ